MPKPSFNGLRVLSLESRRAAEMSTLISNFGGTPTVAPALREVPLSSNPAAIAFGGSLIQGQFDAVVFLTGVGARALLAVIESDPGPQTPDPEPRTPNPGRRDAFLDALKRVKVIARGPKPVAVLREWQVPVWVTAPEPNTWRELLSALDARWGELPQAPRMAVQEYGVANTDLLDGLSANGALVTSVPVYQWALPEDVGPLKAAVESLAKKEIDVVLLTTGVQLVHLFEIAESMHLVDEMTSGLKAAVIASIGPTTSEEIQRRGLHVDLEASHPKMGVLVTEAAEKAGELIRNRRAD